MRRRYLSHSEWWKRYKPEGERVVATMAERLRGRMDAVEPIAARGPRSGWYWPATVAWLNGETYATIGRHYGRSRERVSQVVWKTLLQLAHRDAPDLCGRLEALDARSPWARYEEERRRLRAGPVE